MYPKLWGLLVPLLDAHDPSNAGVSGLMDLHVELIERLRYGLQPVSVKKFHVSCGQVVNPGINTPAQ